MVICNWCKYEMTEVATCTQEGVEYPDGTVLPSIRHKITIQPFDEWIATWDQMVKSDPSILRTDSREDAIQRYQLYATGRCHDCNIENGGVHHPGCNAERCPKCGGQLISCGCLDEDEL